MKSVKTQAALDLAKITLAVITATLIAIAAVKYLGLATVMIIAGVAAMIYTGKNLFELRCAQIEMQRKLTDSSK